MSRVIRCDCGFEVHAEGDDELVDQAQSHARNAHDMEISAELVLGLARPPLRTPCAPNESER